MAKRYCIRGVDVEFPFDAYNVQLSYMEKVIEALQKRQHALLESPTGTGKTLSLLCAVLGWRNTMAATSQNGEGNAAPVQPSGNAWAQVQASVGMPSTMLNSPIYSGPRILYASRTHMQLAQVVRELRKTTLAPLTCVLGSREQMCIHPIISQSRGNTQNHMCQKLVDRRGCRFHMGVDHNVNRLESELSSSVATKGSAVYSGVMDVEDLVTRGKRDTFCPFYMARHLCQKAELTLMPYNYLAHDRTRKTLKIDLANTVVIFDEAHNLEQVCLEGTSFELSGGRLSACINELSSVVEYSKQHEIFSSTMAGLSAADFLKLKEVLLNLEAAILAIDLPANPNPLRSDVPNGVSQPGEYIISLLRGVGITEESAALSMRMAMAASTTIKEMQRTALDSLVEALEIIFPGASAGTEAEGQPAMPDGIALARVYGLDPNDPKVLEGLNQGLGTPTVVTGGLDNYKVFVSEDADRGPRSSGALQSSSNPSAGTIDGFLSFNSKQPSNQKKSRTLSFWCFNAKIAMQRVVDQGVRTIIVTSGTLAPLDSFEMDLGVPFPIRLENPHIIPKHQVWVGIIPKGPQGHTLKGDYHNRSTVDYKADLGAAILNLARQVPSGLLVFFPSYGQMAQCVQTWKSGTIWASFKRLKHCVEEPRDPAQFKEALDGYYGALKSPQGGAILFAVCRGKVSEGLDFKDDHGRAVVVAGLPYPSIVDPKVRLKREYVDEQRRNSREMRLSGGDWYVQQMSRAVNQAVGRIIRHKDDYGAIVLMDTRYSESQVLSQLSHWMQPHSIVHPTFGNAINSLSTFFRHVQSLGLSPGPAGRVVPRSVERIHTPTLYRPESESDDPIAFSGPPVALKRSFDDTSSVEPAPTYSGQVNPFRAHVSLKDAYAGVTSTAAKAPAPPLPNAAGSIRKKRSRSPGSVLQQMGRPGARMLPSDRRSGAGNGKKALMMQQSMKSFTRSQEGAATAVPKRPLMAIQDPDSPSLPQAEGPQTPSSSKFLIDFPNGGPAFLALVKRTLSSADFKSFAEDLRLYKARSLTVREVMSRCSKVLAGGAPGTLPADSLAGAGTSRARLLRGFPRFVPSKNQVEYERMVMSGYGAALGLKKGPDTPAEEESETGTNDLGGGSPTLPLSPVRVQIRDHSRAHGPDSTLFPSSSRPSYSNDPNGTTIVKLSATPPFHPPRHPPIPSASQMEMNSATMDLNDPLRRGNLKRKRRRPAPATMAIAPPTDRVVEHRATQAHGSTQPHERSPDMAGGEREKGSRQASGRCPVCQEPARVPFAAQCGHVCCYECWENWLSSKLECPVCRKLTRKKHLIKLFFG